MKRAYFFTTILAVLFVVNSAQAERMGESFSSDFLFSQEAAVQAPVKETVVTKAVAPIGAETPAAPAAAPQSSNKSACYSKLLLQAAKNQARKRWNNRPNSGGQCALGVRLILDAAHMNRSGGLGDAIDYHIAGKAKMLGFENIKTPGMTAANAPPGSLLVFRALTPTTTLETTVIIPEAAPATPLATLLSKAMTGTIIQTLARAIRRFAIAS